MKYCVSVFVKGSVSDVIKVLNEIADMRFHVDGDLHSSAHSFFRIELSNTPDSILTGVTAMRELDIDGEFFGGLDLTGFHTMLDVTCSSPDFATCLLPLADSLASALSQQEGIVCLLYDDAGDQLIREYQGGEISRAFALPTEYVDGLYWQPNPKYQHHEPRD